MSVNQAADAQDATTAAEEEQSSATDTQTQSQGDKAPTTGADGDDYAAQRNAFLADEKGFLKSQGVADADLEETSDEPAEENLEENSEEATTEEETPAADAAEETETEEAAEEKPKVETDEVTEEPPKRKHVNLARMGEAKAKLVMYLDRNPDVPLDKAIEILGLKLTPEQQAEAKTEAENGLPKTVADAEARIEELWEERTKAFGDDLDFKKSAELDREIAKLQKHVGSLREQELAARTEQTTRAATEAEESERNAIKYYPDCADAESPLVKKMVELDQLLEETDDERFHSPNKPFILAKMAAKELGIAPRNPKATAAASSPSVPVKKAPVAPVQPARGNARTQSTTARTGSLDEQVDNVRDEDSYEAAKKAILKTS